MSPSVDLCPHLNRREREALAATMSQGYLPDAVWIEVEKIAARREAERDDALARLADVRALPDEPEGTGA